MTTLSASHVQLGSLAQTGVRWQVLLGAIMIQLILGTLYGYSVFWQPLEQEIWSATTTIPLNEITGTADAALPVPPAAGGAAAVIGSETRAGYLKYAFGICLLSFATAMVFAGRLQDIKGPRFTAILGGLVLGLGFFIAGQMDHMATFYVCHALLMGTLTVAALLLFGALSSRLDVKQYPIIQYVPQGIVVTFVVGGLALANSFISGDQGDRVFLLWVSIGLLAGVGIGYAYVCPIAALVKWFPHHKGLVSGISVAGFGLGAYLFSSRSPFGAVGFIERYDMSTFFTVHGLVCAIVITMGAMLLRNPPVEGTVGARPAPRAVFGDTTWHELLHKPAFHLVWLMFFSGAMAGLMVLGILKPFAGGQLVEAAIQTGRPVGSEAQQELLAQGAVAVGIFALFNAAGRVVWGLASDYMGRSRAMTIMFVLQGVTLLILSSMKSEFQLAAAAACVGFNFGGNFAVFPSLTADLFGARNFGANYGWVFTSYGVAGITGVWAGNTAQRLTGSYFAAFALAAALCFVSALLAINVNRHVRRAHAAG
jgi:OFA family oxalate/formate antiporter-like MFS transporter